MSDLRELLRDAAETPRELDVDRVERNGRRRQQRPRTIGLAAVAAAVIVATGSVLLVSGDNHDRKVIAPAGTGPDTSQPGPPATDPHPTATAPTVSPPAADSLSASSLLGYEGLGPIKLGMTFTEIEVAGQVRIRSANSACPIYSLVPTANSGLEPRPGTDHYGVGVWAAYPFTEPPRIDEIDITDPAIHTISGVHIGNTYDEVLRTYPFAIETGVETDQGALARLAITNPEGRTITFYFALDRTLDLMSLGLTPTTVEDHAQC